MYRDKNLTDYSTSYIMYTGNNNDVLGVNAGIPFVNKRRDYLSEYDGLDFRPKRHGLYVFRGYTYWAAAGFSRVELSITRSGVTKVYDMLVSSVKYNLFEASTELFPGDSVRVITLAGGTLADDDDKHFLTIAKRQ